jgi:hypothetical protein
MGSVKTGTDISLWLFAGDTTATGVLTATAADAWFNLKGTDTTMLWTFPGGGNDYDGDGYDDFLICNSKGADPYGEVWILWGDSTPYSNTDPEQIDSAGTTIATGSSTLDVGFVCGSAGDWTGDGTAEVWMYSQSTTDMYLLAGDDTLRDGAVDVAASYLALYHFDSFTNDPDELRDVGDLDGLAGGMHEMAVSISAATSTVVPGQVYILGPDLGFGEVPDSVETLAQATFWGDEAGAAEEYGATISGRAADVTGAGGTYRTDIVVADPGYDSNAGAVYVYPNYNE